jgi:ABC-type dipeptide/oligopeptide/nickel transport system permease subunit
MGDPVIRTMELTRRVAPDITISLAVLRINLLGDGLRDALDPRLRT